MKNLTIFSLAIATLALMGCTKTLKPLSSDNFSANPTPLAVHGQKVDAAVTANFPTNYFEKNAVLKITPVLVSDYQQWTAEPYFVQGEKVRDNNPVINYENGGNVTIPVSFNYEPAMDKSELRLFFDVTQKSKQYTLTDVKVDEGVIATEALADAATVAPAIAPDKFQRVINEKYTADIKFLVNQTNIRASELQQESVKSLQQTIKDANADEKKEIEEINISSYASPEGGVEVNTRVASGREKSTQQYLDKELKKNGIDNNTLLTADFTAQDWEGFRQLVSQSNIQDKNLILSVLEMYKDPETREKEIRNLSSVFDQLAKEVLPQLRRSRLTASINTIGKSDEEMKEAYNNDINSLTVDELLYYASTLKNVNDQAQAYKRCLDIYPNDYRAANNLGSCLYKEGQYDQAKSYFEKAASLNKQSKEPLLNMALCDMLNDNLENANAKLGQAAGVPNMGEALGTYLIKTGDYNAAVKAFAQSKTNNAALAQILTGDYSSARNTLSAVANPDAITHYLMAIIGARTNNEDIVTSSLKKACSLNSALANKAKNDIEFSKFNLSNIF
ncbi:MAG: tetratricopeptide repeat protein [Muribaculaceae bacterium]|nr:tetratricopeptide repeat protein [Muribaculaceae bacterium]